jgi:hypothetical protein
MFVLVVILNTYYNTETNKGVIGNPDTNYISLIFSWGMLVIVIGVEIVLTFIVRFAAGRDEFGKELNSKKEE